MSDLSKRVLSLERFSSALDAINFNVAPNKNGFIVRFGEKFKIIECSEESLASSLSDELNGVVLEQKKKTDGGLADVFLRSEQLDLFNKG